MKNIKINGTIYYDVEKINVKDSYDSLVSFTDSDKFPNEKGCYYYDENNDDFSSIGEGIYYCGSDGAFYPEGLGGSGLYYYDGWSSFSDASNILPSSSGYYYYSTGSGSPSFTEINGVLIEDTGVYEVLYNEGYYYESLNHGWFCYDINDSLYSFEQDRLFYTNRIQHEGDYHYNHNFETDCIWSCDNQGVATKYDSMEVGDEVTITFNNGQEYKLTRTS